MDNYQETRKHWFLNRIGKRIFAIKPRERVGENWQNWNNYGVLIENRNRALELYHLEQWLNQDYSLNFYEFRFFDTKEEADDYYIPQSKWVFQEK